MKLIKDMKPGDIFKLNEDGTPTDYKVIRINGYDAPGIPVMRKESITKPVRARPIRFIPENAYVNDDGILCYPDKDANEN